MHIKDTCPFQHRAKPYHQQLNVHILKPIGTISINKSSAILLNLTATVILTSSCFSGINGNLSYVLSLQTQPVVSHLSWVRLLTSHKMKTVATTKRKYAKANSLSLLLKIMKAEEKLYDEIEKDHAIFEAKVFKSCRMSDLQKYLHSIHKKIPYLKKCSGNIHQV